MKKNLTDEYEDPHIYDAEYGSYREDMPFFLNLRSKGDVLDLACGTGRLTIPLAKKGCRVIGLDTTLAMLARARKNATGVDINWVHGDMTQFALDQSFDLITLAGNSFQALLTEKEQYKLFTCVKKHLKPAGIFAFDTRNPLAYELISTSEFEQWHSFEDADGKLVAVYGQQTYDKTSQIITYTTKRVWHDHETLSTIQLRYASLEHITCLIQKSGMTLLNAYGDHQNNAYTENSPSIVVVCTKLEDPENE